MPRLRLRHGSAEQGVSALAATKDRSAKNPYVAFENERMAATNIPSPATLPFEVADAKASEAEEVGRDDLAASRPAKPPQTFLKSLTLVAACFTFGDMKRTLIQATQGKSRP